MYGAILVHDFASRFSIHEYQSLELSYKERKSTGRTGGGKITATVLRL